MPLTISFVVDGLVVGGLEGAVLAVLPAPQPAVAVGLAVGAVGRRAAAQGVLPRHQVVL